MSMNDPVDITEVSLSLPFGIGSVKWKPDPAEREAAWSLYVELVTRVATQSLDLDHGLLREGLSSMHSLFGSTREILRAAGPRVGARRDSVGGIAIAVLNKGLRPFLSKWHPELQEWEESKAAGVSPKAHEKAWPEEPKLRGELEKVRGQLQKYADALAELAGVRE